mgnify:CR=1 FL=1
MKGEKLDGNLEKGFGMLRKDISSTDEKFY